MAKPTRESHPIVPHLYRLRTAASDVYPYLPRELTQSRQRPKQQKVTSSLLPDATRGAMSPLGGAAVASKRNGGT